MAENSLSTSKTAGRVRSRGLVAGFFLSVSALGFWVGQSLPTSETTGAQDAGPPPLHVDPEALDFGEAWVQRDFQWTLPVTNMSPTDVHVLNIEQSCRCTSVEPQSFVLKPGETRVLRATLDLTDAAPRVDGTAREFGVYLAPVIAGRPSGEHRWHLRGRVSAWLTASPAAVYLGNRSERAHGPFPPQSVRLLVHEMVAELLAECPPELASVRLSACPVEASDTYELEIVPASLPLGPIEFPVTLTGTSASGTPLPAASLRVIGRVVKDVQCFPPALTLGVCAPGEPFDERIELRSLTTAFFDVTGIRTTDDRLAVREAGPRNVFRVLGRTTGEGLQTGEVVFTVCHRDGTMYPVTLPVRYVVQKSASNSR